jgi:oxidase EvaA
MRISDVQSWIESCVLASQCTVKKIPFSNSREWIYTQDIIHHQTNKFFKIIGLEWNENQSLKHQPFIDQKEIGTLGFLLYKKNIRCTYILVQGKVEPGNVGLVQISPTCQATSSNIKRVHGGKRPEFTRYFESKKYIQLSNSLQSEQGDRFYKKKNRNVLISIDSMIPHATSFQWMSTKMFSQALSQNFLVNTDARSVVVCSNWGDFMGQELFNENDHFTHGLRKSYRSRREIMSLKYVLSERKRIANTSHDAKIIPLGNLSQYEIGDRSIVANNTQSVQVVHIQVRTKTREVTFWDQPIISSKMRHEYIIYCGRQKNTLYFLFHFWSQPGLFNKVELGPSSPPFKRKGVLVRTILQSEEGGRFFKDINKYSLIDIGNIDTVQSDEAWLNLRQIQILSRRSGIFTSEARSNISLILATDVK